MMILNRRSKTLYPLFQPFFNTTTIRTVISSTSDLPTFPYSPPTGENNRIATARGIGVLHDPVLSKGTGHPLVERERLGLRGLLPPRVHTLEEQLHRMMERYHHGTSWILNEESIDQPDITQNHLRQWMVLQEVQDRNETLFYRSLLDNFVEMAPIIYTPTVGHVCRNYHKLFLRPRGMYFSAKDRGEMNSMVWNWPNQVDAIVVTDGSRILGLGDLGANGLGISVGKLDLYVSAGGFDPGRVLPCVIDVGTDNQELIQDKWYMGLKQPRLTGADYYQVVDEFVHAVMGRWPNAILQFEDFNLQHAAPLLERYRYNHCVFNDDIQGTAATAVAGLLGSMAVLGKPPGALADQRIVVVGAGSAGMGVVRMIAQSMIRYGVDEDEVTDRFFVLDKEGLITVKRGDELPSHVKLFARKDEESREGESLVDVIRRVKPTVLIGLAGAGRLFTQDALRSMGEFCERPIIMAMSNPTSKMECTHEEAQAATGGRAIYACGSPQQDVKYNGKICAASQANNMYIFPGLALGAHLAQGNAISDAMVHTAAEALPKCLSLEELQQGRVYPHMKNIRDISLHVAVEVIKTAADEGHVANPSAMRALGRGDESLKAFVFRHMYYPRYTSLVASPNSNSHF